MTSGHPWAGKLEEIELGDLGDASAAAFLIDNGVPSEEASAIVQQVGGSPLSLKLALRVLALEGSAGKGLRNFKSRRWISFSTDRAVIQGQLYRRILGHIHSQEVRRLAHPGLVLRRITPEIILHVLSKACKVDIADLRRATDLFDELKREVSLVNVESDGSLRHRPDVRRIMLDLIRREKPEQVRMIHEAAVQYYRRRSTPSDRAEELYHMLQLGASRRELDERWSEAAEPYLRSAVEELASPQAQLYLAGKLDVAIDKEIWTRAELEDIERRCAQATQSLVDVGEFPRALITLRKQKKRSRGSPLYLLEASALYGMRDLAAARKAVDKALESAVACGDYRAAFNGLMLSGNLHRSTENLREAIADYERAAQLGHDLEEAEYVFRATMHVLESKTRLFELNLGEHRTAILREIVELLENRSDSELERLPALMRMTAGVVGAEAPHVLVRTLGIVGLGTLNERHQQLVASVLQRSGSAAIQRELAAELTRWVEEPVRIPSMPEGYWQELVEGANRAGILNAVVERAVKARPWDRDLIEVVALVLRESATADGSVLA